MVLLTSTNTLDPAPTISRSAVTDVTRAVEQEPDFAASVATAPRLAHNLRRRPITCFGSHPNSHSAPISVRLQQASRIPQRGIPSYHPRIACVLLTFPCGLAHLQATIRFADTIMQQLIISTPTSNPAHRRHGPVSKPECARACGESEARTPRHDVLPRVRR